ncbi:MAG: DUF4178 domain-containing protein, partial [Pseudomonadota bacterium]
RGRLLVSRRLGRSVPGDAAVTGAVRSIDCTNCGAGLEVLGGGRVTTQVCGYCGASLDANDAYRVLEVFAGMQRPASPFRLGMTGSVNGVAFTIVGTLGKVERYDGQTWTWVDHQLYSPTHGYGWLTVEDGHTLLTRKVRDWPVGPFLTERSVEVAESRPSRRWRGTVYSYYETSSWAVDFVEGEFTWRPSKGLRGRAVAMMAQGPASAMLSYAENGTERELEVTRYAPEAALAFGAEAPVPQGVHPLQPYAPKTNSGFYRLWFGGMAAVSLAGALILSALTLGEATLWDGPVRDLPEALTFEVTDTGRPALVRLRHDIRNDWSEFALTLTGPDGAPLADTVRGISYYAGSDWSEGSRATSLGFQPEAPGPHRIALALDAAGSPAVADRPLRVTVQDGRSRPLWLWVATGLFALGLLWAASSQMRHRLARWSGSDWSDE